MAQGSEEDYSLESLKKLTKTRPAIKLRYSQGETGWAADLGDGRAVIDNIPLIGPLRYLDVVEVVTERRSIPKAGEVIWRAYGCKALVQYPEHDAATWYDTLKKLCQQREWACEGAVAGYAAVCLPSGVDLVAELKRAALPVQRLELDCDG